MVNPMVMVMVVMVVMTCDQCRAVTRDLQLGPHVGDCKSDGDFDGDFDGDVNGDYDHYQQTGDGDGRPRRGAQRDEVGSRPKQLVLVFVSSDLFTFTCESRYLYRYMYLYLDLYMYLYRYLFVSSDLFTQ